MSEKLKHIIHPGTCPELDKLVQYRQGKLNAAESHWVEKHLAACEMCSDVLEGLENMPRPENLPKIETELKKRITRMLTTKKERNYPLYLKRWAAAASLLLLLGLSVFIYHTMQQKPQLVLESAAPKTQVQKPEGQGYTPAKPEPQIAQNAPVKKQQKPKPVVMEVIDRVAQSVSSDEAVFIQTESKMADVQVEEIKAEAPVMTEITVAENLKAETKGHAPTRSISGIVTDELGNRLPGATIRVKGKGANEKAAITAINGSFEIETNAADKELEISYIGYNTETRPIGRDTLNISLTPAQMALNEVVVTGYAKQKKSEVTGAITTYSGKNNNKPTERQLSLYRERQRLEFILGHDSLNTQVMGKLIAIYLEEENPEMALAMLQKLNSHTTNPMLKTAIIEVTGLVKNDKFSKAVKAGKGKLWD